MRQRTPEITINQSVGMVSIYCINAVVDGNGKDLPSQPKVFNMKTRTYTCNNIAVVDSANSEPSTANSCGAMFSAMYSSDRGGMGGWPPTCRRNRRL